MIRLRLIGTLDLRTSNGAELRAILAQPRRFALLAYLAASSPRGFHRRDAILALFWPDQEQSRARASLNRALYFLRRELGDGILVSRGDEEIGLDRSRFCCDVADLEDALENGQLRDALELYRGDLLPGFFVSDAAGFEDWLERERTRLRERVSDAAWTCAEQAEAAVDFTLAAHWARRGLELAPFREVAVRRLLSLLDRAGDRAGAAHAYNRFATEIEAELDLAPSPETRALIDAIRSRTQQRAHTSGAEHNERVLVASRPAVVAPSPHARPRSRRPTLAWALPVAALGVVLLTARTLLARGEALDLTRVDVATFENRTGDAALDNLARTATDRVIGGLGQVGLFKSIRPVHTSMTSGWRESWTRLVRFGRALPPRSGVTVVGALTRDGKELHFRASLRELRNGGSVWELHPILLSATAPEDAMREVRDRIVGGAAALGDSVFARVIPHATHPPTFDAYQEYKEAFKAAASRHSAEAVTRYRLAAALDTSFTWALVQAAHTELGEFRRPANIAVVDTLLASLARVRSRLPALQQHLLDYMMAVRADDRAAAHDAMRRAADLAPLAYSYRLALRAMDLNRPREIVDVLTRHGVDTIFLGDTRGYWLMLTLGYHQLGEHRNELEAARRARHYRPDSPSALTHEIKALAALGRIDAVRARIDTVLAMPREDWFTPADAMMAAAVELRAHEHLEASREIVDRAIAWLLARPVQDQQSEQRRWQLGTALYMSGDWLGADSLFQGLDAEFPNNDEYVGWIGVIAARRGERAAARRMSDRLVQLDRMSQVPGQQAVLWRAKIAALLGDQDGAVRLLRDAFGPQGTVETHTDIDFESLRDHAGYREFIRPKGDYSNG